MSSQSTKERKAKENQVVLHNGSTNDIKFEGCRYAESIPGGMCVIHRKKSSKVPFITYCLKRLLSALKNQPPFNGNYIEYKNKTKIYHQKNILI